MTTEQWSKSGYLTLIQYYNSKFYIQILSVVPIMNFITFLFPGPGSNSESILVLSCHISLVSLCLEQFLRFLVVCDLDIFETCRPVTFWMSDISPLFGLYIFTDIIEVMFLSVQYIQIFNFDSLISVVSAIFELGSYYFSFVINKQFMGTYFAM